MKTLLEYIQEQQKEYKFRLKFAVPVSSEMHDKLESALAKFEVKKVGKPKKTILQGLAERVKKFIRTEEAPTPGRLPPEALGSGLAGKAGEAIRKRQEMMQQY